MLGDKEFVRQHPLPAARLCYGFKGADDYVFVAWDEIEAEAAGPHIVKVNGAETAYFMDIMGNAAPAKIEKDCVLFPTTSEPRFLVVSKARQTPELAKPLVVTGGRVDAIPGQPLTVDAVLNNPLAAPLEFTTRWNEPAAFGGKAHPESKTVVAAGASQKISLQLPIPANSGIRHGDEVILTLNYRVADMPWSGEIAQPLAMGAYIPRQNPDGRAPDFVLESRDHIVNLNENVPARLHLTWQGADDLSARVWLARRPDGVLLRVDARDDRHSQNNTGEKIWLGDSVQFGIVVPGQKGWWEIGLSADAAMRPQVFCWNRPEGMADPTAQIKLAVSELPDNRGVRYEAVLPFVANNIYFN